MQIRPETPADIAAIFALTKEAFDPMPYSDGSEVAIIDRLRKDGDLTLSLVAEMAGKIVGHVAFSPVTIGKSAGRWFGLGPIAVSPDHQRTGIGSALIKIGHEMLTVQNATGCVLVGDPNYYSQHGYAAEGRISYQNLDTQFVQWISFTEAEPNGEINYSPAFTAQ